MSSRMKFKVFISGLCLLLLMGSCTKYVPGPRGDKGTAGGNGNAKKTNSTTFVQPTTAWKFSTENGWTSVIYLSAIDENTLRNGEIQVYMQSDGKWWTLPFYKGDVVTSYTADKGYITVSVKSLHNEIILAPAATNFRLVLLSPA